MSSQTPTSSPANNAVTVVFPTTRVDGSALALSEIATLVISKAVGAAAAAVVLTQQGPFTGPSFEFTDDSPDFGQTDNYAATVTDVEGNVSGAGTGSVAVPPSVLVAPSAPSLTAVFNAAVAAASGSTTGT